MSLEPRTATRVTSIAVANSRPYGAGTHNGSPAPGVAGVAAEIADVLTGELDRYHDEWRRLFATLHETLSPLSRLCETASQRKQVHFAPALLRLVDQLTAAAAADAEAATKTAHAAAAMKVADAKAAVERLDSELHSVRARLQASGEELERERAAWAETRAQWEKARRDDQHAASAWLAQLQDVQAELETTRAEFTLMAQQLETERTERARLAAALEGVQRALRFDAHTGGEQAAASGGAVERSATEAPLGSIDTRSTGEPIELRASPTRTLALVPSPRTTDTDDSPELADYVRELLRSVEDVYRADVESSLPPVKAVDRLTEHLRGARDCFITRRNRPDGDDPPLFKRHLLAFLDSRWDTPFGRHLGIAIYQLYPTIGDRRLSSRAS